MKIIKLAQDLSSGIAIEKEHRDLLDVMKGHFKKTGKDFPLSDDEFFGYIAKAHIREIPDYYVRLKKMEEEAKNENKNK